MDKLKYEDVGNGGHLLPTYAETVCKINEIIDFINHLVVTPNGIEYKNEEK